MFTQEMINSAHNTKHGEWSTPQGERDVFWCDGCGARRHVMVFTAECDAGCRKVVFDGAYIRFDDFFIGEITRQVFSHVPDEFMEEFGEYLLNSRDSGLVCPECAEAGLPDQI